MATKIIIWMIAGFLLGSLINTFAFDVAFIQDYLVYGLFHIVGTIFINLLKMLVVPLVTFSLICGVCGIGDVKKLGRVGIKAFCLFLLTTTLAISLALLVSVTINPGKDFHLAPNAQTEFVAPEPPLITQVFIDLVPSNPVTAFAEGNMLQIIFFTILFAICLLMIGKRGRSLIDGAEKLNEVMMQVVSVVMSIAPYGVFAIMTKTFALQGIDLILPMIGYFGIVILVLFCHVTGTLMLLLKFFGRISPIQFLKKMRTAQIFAFSTSSSNATIPVTLRTVEKRMGVDNSTASFVVPFGATINMDGTAIMQGVATVFIANIYGIELGLTGYLTVIGMSVLASIGTAGVPGVGLIMLAMVFDQLGLPVEGIALIMGVDRVLDMMRTAVNVTGDAVITMIVARSENNVSMEIFNDQDAGTLTHIELPHDKK
ncbi:dicarboxylate/amino acid:cation symporter [Nitrosomonas supralitoralis]|uniref:Dicarboxylate/amino acid:cation symporter n=1 Tax=Nitrosomonas supralitoralis TaxID=2116706 RepID=A0A2P7NXS3_9PROT|nr:dicarboxylate/amino acid:cation symporter [Nitrosomonas supralitoralis]PSJ18264.1 dicarboxylate/amino acid:cation symporter [Nitrosomonas supralitoralis]